MNFSCLPEHLFSEKWNLPWSGKGWLEEPSTWRHFCVSLVFLICFSLVKYWVVFSGGCLISLFYCIWVQCMCSKFTFLCLFPHKVLNGINCIKFRIRKRLSCGFQYKFLAEFARKPISVQDKMIKTCHRIPGEKNMSLEPCCVTRRNSVYRMLAFLCMWKI